MLFTGCIYSIMFSALDVTLRLIIVMFDTAAIPFNGLFGVTLETTYNEKSFHASNGIWNDFLTKL